MKILNITLLVPWLLLVGCGGGGGGGETSNSTPPKSTPPAEPEQQALSAEQDFQFRVDHEIILSLSAPAQQKGSFQVYTRILAEDPNSEMFMVDPSSVVASLPHSVESYHLMVNDNWNELLVEWQPRDGNQSQQLQRVSLNGQNQYAIQFDN
ncbi:hypothetical protein ACP3V5_06270 [Vibrio maritimus]